jgi:hypothetical protein
MFCIDESTTLIICETGKCVEKASTLLLNALCFMLIALLLSNSSKVWPSLEITYTPCNSCGSAVSMVTGTG